MQIGLTKIIRKFRGGKDIPIKARGTALKRFCYFNFPLNYLTAAVNTFSFLVLAVRPEKGAFDVF